MKKSASKKFLTFMIAPLSDSLYVCFYRIRLQQTKYQILGKFKYTLYFWEILYL